MKKQIKNEITTSGFVMMRCPFCMEEMKHEINFKCYGFNTQIHQQEVHFYKTCTACDWVQNVFTSMTKTDYENLKLAK